VLEFDLGKGVRTLILEDVFKRDRGLDC